MSGECGEHCLECICEKSKWKALENLATYSAIKQADQMSHKQKIEFLRQFQEDLKNDSDLKEMYDEFVLRNCPVP